MLSNPNPPMAGGGSGSGGGVASGLHPRHRQHRRQNSTPTAFEAVKMAPLPQFSHGHGRPSHLASGHRRGLSLDTRRMHMLSPSAATTTTRQDCTTVSTSTTNAGLTTTTSASTTAATNLPQHVLQRTRQQRIASPGNNNQNTTTTDFQLQQATRQLQQHQQQLQLQQQQQRQQATNNNFSLTSPDTESFLLSPHGTPHSARFVDAMGDMNGGLPFDAYLGNMKKNAGGYAANNGMSHPNLQGFDLFAAAGQDSALSTPTFMTFPDASPAGSNQGWISEGEGTGHHSRRTSRRISNGIMDKVAKFEAMGGEMNGMVQRPITPPNQNAANYFPPTPMETPHDRMMKHEPPRPSRFSDDYDESMEETIKPVRGHNRNSNRSSGIFQDLRQQAEAALTQTPPSTQGPQRANTMPMTYAPNQQGLMVNAPDFMSMSNVNAEFIKIEHGFDGMSGQGPVNITPDLSHHTSTPMTPQLSQFSAQQQHAMGPAGPADLQSSSFDFDSQATMVPYHPNLPPDLTSPTREDCTSSGPRSGTHSHRRTESIASIASAASIASLNIEETKTDTGVSIDDIAAFIEGPDVLDGKWVCVYEGCNKRFGRKENIKSHVQTHLNDRQYQCPTCKKCFVRQHDLKRHAKIHTGIKPYPCDCGNSFARHDALTRHRQRGMCIGAFDGIVRKVVKRGRPRKNRPEMDERREKSERTRRKNSKRAADAAAAAAESSASGGSHSGYSDSSAVNSPCNDFDSILDNQPFPDMLDVTMADCLPGTTATAMDDAHHGHGLGLGLGIGIGLGVSSAPMTSSLDAAEMVAPATVSPQQVTAASPSAMSTYSHASHTSMSGGIGEPGPAIRHFPGGSDDTEVATTTIEPHALPLLSAASPAKSVASHYTHVPGTPPALSASSSPPPTAGGGANSRFFDLGDDPNSSGLSDGSSIGLGTTMAAHAAALSAGVAHHHHHATGASMAGLVAMDDEMLLQAFGQADEDGLVQIDRDLLLGTTKFVDEDYDAAVSMFTNGDDLFFGSS